MKKQKKNSQFGYTLIELTIGLAVTSLVIAGILMGVQKLMRDLDTTRTIKQVFTAADSIRRTVSRDADANEVTMQKMTANNINAFYLFNVTSPDTADAKAYTALGNNVVLLNSSTVSTAYNVPTDTLHFRMALENVKPDVCAELMSGLEGAATRVWVKEQGVVGLGTEIKSKTMPFLGKTARDGCGNGSDRAIVLEYKIY